MSTTPKFRTLIATAVGNESVKAELKVMYPSTADEQEKVPYLKRKPSKDGNYTVQEGDSLWKLSKKFNTTVDELARLNNIDDANRGNIYAGEKLFVPEIPEVSERNIFNGNDLLFTVPTTARNMIRKNINYLKASYNVQEQNVLKSRIQYNGNGIFSVNLNNLNKVTRNNHRIASLNPKNWTYNSQTGQQDLGISTIVGKIQIQNSPIADRPDYIPFGIEQGHTTIRTVGENAKSTGKPDRRVGRDINTTSSPAATRGGAGIMLALNAFFVSYDLWSAYSVNQDLNAIEREKGLLQIAFKAVEESINVGIVPPQYQNNNDIGAIVNFVFQGINNTGNQNITTIGTDILKAIRRYDTQTQTIKPLIEK